MSRSRIEEFCTDFLTGCYVLPSPYREELMLIDIEFTKESIKPRLTRIFREVLHDAINFGRVITVLAFAEVLYQRYFWCSADMMVDIFTNVLEEIHFCPGRSNVEYYLNLLSPTNCFFIGRSRNRVRCQGVVFLATWTEGGSWMGALLLGHVSPYSLKRVDLQHNSIKMGPWRNSPHKSRHDTSLFCKF